MACAHVRARSKGHRSVWVPGAPGVGGRAVPAIHYDARLGPGMQYLRGGSRVPRRKRKPRGISCARRPRGG